MSFLMLNLHTNYLITSMILTYSIGITRLMRVLIFHNFRDSIKSAARVNYFNHLAKKFGIGEDLKDAEQEMKPRIKEVVVKTNFAKLFHQIFGLLWGWCCNAKPWEECLKAPMNLTQKSLKILVNGRLL